jgi:hypothetical protein
MRASTMIIISICGIVLIGGSLAYIYSPRPISTQERSSYIPYMMKEDFGKNGSRFDYVQVDYTKYLDPVNSTIGVTAMGPHKFNDCSIIYQSKRSNKMLWYDENITNRGEGFSEDPTMVLNSTNRLIFECTNPSYSIAWPYMEFDGIPSSENTVSVKGKLESQSNITLTIYSCVILKCETENRHLIAESNMTTMKDGGFTYSFTIPQTNDNLLYTIVQLGTKEYMLGSRIGQ